MQAKQVRAEMAKQTVPQFEMRHRMALALEYGDVSVATMATVLEASRTTISNFLHGRTVPKRPTLIVWAQTCNVPVEWLIDGVTPELMPEPQPVPRSAKKASKSTRKQGSKTSPCTSDTPAKLHIVQGLTYGAESWDAPQ